MEKRDVKFASNGEPGLLVLEVPNEIAYEGVGRACLAIPLRQRSGGLLLALPLSALDSDSLIDEMSGTNEGILGPSKSMQADLLAEDEGGNVYFTDKSVRFYVVDFSDEILAYLREYDVNLDPEANLIAFDDGFPLGLPRTEGLDEQILAWVTTQEVGRAHFYSAREEPDVPAVNVANGRSSSCEEGCCKAADYNYAGRPDRGPESADGGYGSYAGCSTNACQYWCRSCWRARRYRSFRIGGLTQSTSSQLYYQRRRATRHAVVGDSQGGSKFGGTSPQSEISAPISCRGTGGYTRTLSRRPIKLDAPCIGTAEHRTGHFGGSFIPFEVLRRKPSSQQINVHKRLRGFLKSEAVAGTFKISAAGRKFPQLSARLAELSSAVTFLGLSGSPYTKAFQGAEVAVNNSVMEELEPYRSLDASRLKLSGSGLWDITPWLPDELVMAYREPASIYIDRSPHPGEYPRMSDSPEELNRLAKVWDARGLLYLHHEEIPDHEQVRIFNCYKGPLIDRQIGDRRGRNAKECRLCGPSSQLPSAVDILDLIVAEDESLYISCSDRKDFYHQLWSSERRSLTNSLGPPLPAEWLTETKAYGAYCLKYSKKKYNRSAHGDRLGMGLPVFEKAGNANLRVAFSSILQGDHGGVEFATASHEQLLKSHGCLDFTTRALASRPLFDPKVADGLVIDDYFAVSVEKHQTPKENTTSHYLHERALQAYANEELLGSPEKDVVAENFGKVIGAQLNSSPMARRNGLTLASSATEKRIALSWISLQIAQLRRTTDQLHLCLTGGWVSSLLFRRPAMSILDKIFHVVGDDYTAAGEPKILHVSGQVADELTLLAVLMPLFQSDLSAPLCPSIFASDASIERGAIVEAEINPGIAGLLHRACKSKGSYTRLAPRGSLLIREVDDDEWDNPGIDVPGPSRPPAFKYHFIELFAGAARVTDHLQQMGFVCGPPIDISWSEEYDLRYHHVMSWVSYMLCEGRLDGVMTEPPCTTFSVMRRPALRDRDFPFGFEPHHSQTMVGNELAQRGFQTLHFADAYDAAALLETPNSSKMKNLPSWGHLRDRPNFNMVRCDSCRFGSPHLKSFKFLGVNIKMDLLAKRCCCTTKHLQVQGQYTKKSATYTEDLAHSLALAFSEAILAVHRRREYLEEIEVDGKENILVNEVAKTARWKVNGDWAFKSKSHINLLELSAVVELARRVAKRFGSCRVLALVDSIVVRGACSKGRSASKGISRLLRRFCSICVAAGLYFTTPYCPTRLNTSDDPTRGRPIRDRQPDAWLSEWSPEDLYRLATKQTLRRWASNWCSLIIKLLGSKVVYFNDRSLFRGFPLRSSQLHWGGMDFDATLGYPGEGPLLRFRSALIAFSWILRSSVSVFCFLPVCLVLSRGGGVMAMPITARNPRDTARARTRDGVELIPGRQVLPVTNSMRASLMAAFRAWTEEELVPWDELMANAHLYVDEINAVIVRFGRCLFQIGRPYNHYAETINAIATEKPSIRRLLQPAWNLAFGWLQREPNVQPCLHAGSGAPSITDGSPDVGLGSCCRLPWPWLGCSPSCRRVDLGDEISAAAP